MKKWVVCALLATASCAAMASEPALTSAVFVETVARDGRLDMELNKLALRKSATPEVQQFARRMIDHHDRMSAELGAIAMSRGIEFSAEPDSMREALIHALDTEEGAAFDHVFARRMREEQARTIGLFEAAARSADPDVARFAREALPVLREHNAMARKLVKLAR